ncbi:MAG: methyltransferase [Planctomycetaceae bacterium]
MSADFRCKQFRIRQDACAMKVGTDAILLGAWCSANRPRRILDIGSGTGILALMTAQRFPAADVDAVEVDPMAAQQCAENVQDSPFRDRITVHHSSIQNYVRETSFRYDLIVCNPPWFHCSLKPPDAARSIARHSDSLSTDDLLTCTAQLLAVDEPDGDIHHGGVVNVVLPIDQAESFLQAAELRHLWCSRRCDVRPTPTSNVRRVLLQLKRKSAVWESTRSVETLIVETARHQYSEEFTAMAQDFLLNL